MSDEKDLLPSNATPLERNLALACSRISDVPLEARNTNNPDKCQEALLPWLAWQFSVDEWDPAWSVEAKRAVIKNSAYVHRKKGTISAIRRAVDPLGYVIEIVESKDDTPRGAPHSFRVSVAVTETALTEAVYNQIVRLIDTYKNERSYMSALTVKAEVRGKLHIGAALLSGIKTIVYPYRGGTRTVNGGLFFGAYERTVDRVRVYPAS